MLSETGKDTDPSVPSRLGITQAIGNAIGNSIRNSIGNSMQYYGFTNFDFPDLFLKFPKQISSVGVLAVLIESPW